MGTTLTPTVGVVYYFGFSDGFTAVNGVYRLSKLMTYAEYLEEGGSLLTTFYNPNNKSENDLNSDLATIRDSKILKLIDPDETNSSDTLVYAPLCFLESSPDHNVNKYKRYGVVCVAGYTHDINLLTHITDSVKEHLEAELGQDVDPKIVVLSESWMTSAQYQEILDRRDNNKLKNLNYYKENIRLEKELGRVNTLVTKYEESLINLQNQVNLLKESLVDVPVTTIKFDSNNDETTSNMPKEQIYSGRKYTLPECTITPPEKCKFSYWSSTPDGKGDIIGEPGDLIEVSSYSNKTITFYAIWILAS